MKLVPTPEDPFDAFLDDVREGIVARAARGSSARSFADVMARAHRLDPAITPEASVREAARYAPVVMLERVARRRREPSLHEATRDEANRDMATNHATDRDRPANANMMPATSATAIPSHASRRGASFWLVGLIGRVGLVGLAAALLLGIGIGGAVREAIRASAPLSGHALRLAEEGGGTGVARAVPGDGAPTAPRGRSGAVEDVEVPAAPAMACIPAPVAASSEPGEPAVQVATGGASGAASTARDGGTADDPGPEPEYLRLDRKAEAAWRRGDRRQARVLLDALTRSSAPRKLVEAAYGDLSLLARQDDDRGELERLWRRYLARFPRGVFADDARADLCGSAQAAMDPLCTGSKRRGLAAAGDATNDPSPDR